MTRVTLRVGGMHCPSCAMAIDMDLEELPGVVEAETSFPRSTTTVAYDEERVPLDRIVAAIREAGYEAVLAPTAQ